MDSTFDTDLALSKRFWAIALVLFLSSKLVWGAGFVKEVTSNSLGKAELKEIQNVLGIEVGKKLVPALIDKQLRFIFDKGKYGDVQIWLEEISPQRVRVLIEGTRLRKVGKVDLSQLDSSIVQELGLERELVEGEKLTLTKVSSVREKIKSELAKRGFVDSEVEVTVQDNEADNESNVSVLVKPGKQIKVEKISIKGVDSDLERALHEASEIHEGDVLDSKQVEKSVESFVSYLKKNQYPSAKVTWKTEAVNSGEPTANLVFDVILGQRFQLIIKGNDTFDDESLKELVTQDVLNQTDANVRLKRLFTDKYRSIGFHFVQVEVAVGDPQKDGLVIVRINIDEGKKILIDSVEFDGLWNKDAGKPSEIFFDNAVGVIGRKVFWEEGLEESTQNFVKSLREKGFLSATVTGPRIVFSEDKKGVRLFYDLQMGNQYIVKRIVFAGNSQLKGEELEKSLPFHVGESVNRDLLNSGIGALITKYQSYGYLDVSVALDEASGEGGMGYRREGMEVTYRIQEGKQYRVGGITVEGRNRTQEKVILREVLVKTGEPYNPQLVRQSEENLALTGLFGRAELIASSTAEKPLEKNITVVVSEIKPGFGEVGLGALYEDPLFRLRTFLGVGYRNLFGLNQTASVRSEVSLPISRSNVLIPFVEYSAIVNYRAPYLADLPLTFATQAGFDSFQIASSADGKQSDLQTRAKIEERIEKRITGRLFVQYRLHHLERTRTEVIQREESGNTNTLTDTIDVIGSTGPGLVMDLRNDIYNPSSGSFHSLDLEFAHPYLLSNDRLSFLMALQKNSFYVPISRSLGAAFYAGFGWASALQESALPEARLANELALGGQGSIRGYAPRLFRAPAGTRELAFYNLRAELTTPLFGDVSGAVFFDTGQLFPGLKADDRNDGVGIGVRYKTPVGPVVLNLAHGLSRAAESIVRFTFTVGTI